ncbi:transcription antitermination factor NusB [Corynebacterium aquatimens]|uniref:Transcription antitermination protein NusB n=1 Tax=Corynebacterium aquatimens TaxID=1190508 RepID=A0A931GS52_9CORY|nr:N utilization substance protein B [Corynebacterium aquatimens]WJY65769.1 hypothetical protein CAQUA_05305 [Corynebacterium aquatimens]
MPDYKRHGARYRARRRAVDILFEAETRDMDPVSILDDRAALAEDPNNAVAPIAEYTRTIVAGAAEELDDIDDNIERYLSDAWELGRIPAVDRAIMRVSTWEILFNDDVPGAIAIANAMEMAKEYAGNNASPYIHAVLDDIIQAHSANAPLLDDAAAEAEQPTPAEAAEPAPAEPEQPTPAETAEPAPAEPEQPTPAETAEPAPAEPEQPTPAETAEPAPAEPEQPAPAEQPVGTITDPEGVDPVG